MSASFVLGTVLALEYSKMKPLVDILAQCISNFNVIWIILDLAKAVELNSGGLGGSQAPVFPISSQVMLTLSVHILCRKVLD